DADHDPRDGSAHRAHGRGDESGARGPRPIRVRLGGLRRRRHRRTARAQRGGRARHLLEEERAAVDARPAPEGAQALPPQADAHLGRRAGHDRLRQHQVLRALHREAGHHLGRPARRHQEHLRQAGHPRGGEAAAGLRCRRPVRVRGRLPQDPRGPRGAGRPLPRHRHRAEGAPGALPGVLRHRHPGRRQQVRGAQHQRVVRRLLHLRAQGRARRHPAAGLLPHQHREHGPVRADADHRRRGRLRALRRGLHRADLQHRLAALRGRRDRREEGRPLPLHDHPELVEQRVQPGDQARHLRGRRNHGVGRRQHRLQADHEVPGRLPDGRARPWRDAVDRLRRRGAAPGRRRQDGPRRAAHVELHHQQVRGPWRRSYVVPRPGPGQRGCAPLALQRALRRAAGRPDQPVRHLPLRRCPRGRRLHGSRGHRVQGLRRPALLPDEPGHGGGRGDGDDRARLRGADRQGAADGVRAGAEPVDRASNGRRRWL
ncbi:MAG: Iron-sulfur cluster assembly protein SufB, partial [uncultured Nocardioidaceae bacterium]